MQILTPTGYRDIADCVIGDEVSAFDIATGVPIVNTIETLTRIDAAEFRRWQNPRCLVNGAERFGAHTVAYVPTLAQVRADVKRVDELVIGDFIRLDDGAFVAVTSFHIIDDVLPFTFVRINGAWTLNSEQSIWRNDSRVCHARDIVVGDVVYDDADQPVSVTSVEAVDASYWWRFDISNDHSYIVDGLTVHNASRFWVLGTASWTASNTASWASSSGGAGGQSVPGSSDNVTFDGASGGGTVTVNFGGTITVQSIICGAFTGTLDFATNNNSVTLSASAGLNASGSGTRTLNLGNGTWTLTATATSTPLNFTTTTGLTFSANSSTIVIAATTASTRTLATNGLTFNAITLSANASGGPVSINAATTITTLTVTGQNCLILLAGATQTITTMALNGTSGNEIALMSSSTTSAATISIASNAPTMTWVGFRNITCAGGAAFTASSSFDLGANSGATITAPATGGILIHPGMTGGMSG